METGDVLQVEQGGSADVYVMIEGDPPKKAGVFVVSLEVEVVCSFVERFGASNDYVGFVSIEFEELGLHPGLISVRQAERVRGVDVGWI